MNRSALRWVLSGGILLRTYGLRGLRRRALHELRRRAGSFLGQPSRHVYERSDSYSFSFSYAPAGDWHNLAASEREQIVLRADKILEGRYEAFGHEWRRFPETQEEWRTHPVTAFKFPLVEWWRVPLLPPCTDVKDVWEPARFGWAYDLIRAHAVTRDARYAEAFHFRLSQWMDANPPFKGPHWACGQETAIRALAILHAYDALPMPVEDVDAKQRILRVLGWSGERIADAVGYGLSQRNNHGISEAAGLVHIGARLTKQHPDARRWLRDGITLLNEQIEDQFAEDGWYAQHSFTYMRVALEQALYAQRVLAAHGASLSASSLARLDAAISLLMRVVAAGSGVVPNHGANDGARVLPLALSDYRDFRPLLTFAATVRQLSLPADVPMNGEVTRWLGAAPKLGALVRSDGIFHGKSGWAVARLNGWSVFFRAGKYRHRPSQSDALHLDVRSDDREIITDAGTYAYNAAPPWNNGLASGLLHNGPILDDCEPAQRGPRFLWLSWPKSTLSVAVQADALRMKAERDGVVRREVVVTTDTVKISDRALTVATSMQVTWLLHPEQVNDCCVFAEGSSRIDAAEDDLIGWFSPTYGLRQRSAAIRVRRVCEQESMQIDTTVVRPAAPVRVPPGVTR
jgi:hypothetical protein